MKQIKIDYHGVYNKTRELQTRLQSELREMDAGYRHVQSRLQQLDGRTNAALIEVAAANQIKTRATAEALLQLLAYIENATREVETEEREWTRIFNDSKISRVTINGGAS